MHWLIALMLIAAPRLPHGKKSAGEAQPLPPDEARARAQKYLGTIDTPITAEQWKAVGSAGADVLEPVIKSTDEMPSRRAHALDGLVYAAPDRAAKLVGPIARDESQPTVLRVAALHGAPQVLSPSRLQTELKPVLQKAREPGMRSVAADVLARNGGCAAVKVQAKREKDNAGFEKPLERCQ